MKGLTMITTTTALLLFGCEAKGGEQISLKWAPVTNAAWYEVAWGPAPGEYRAGFKVTNPVCNIKLHRARTYIAVCAVTRDGVAGEPGFVTLDVDGRIEP
jgi:hypothetical protein